MIAPSKHEFEAGARERGRAVLYQDLLADVETPLSAYWKLAQDETCSFLLESVTGGEQVGRYSVLGVRPKAVLRTKGKSAIPDGKDPLDLLQEALGAAAPAGLPDMPPFVGGAVGLLSYDLVRFFERKLGAGPPDDLNLDDVALMLCDTVVVFDHAKTRMRVVSTAGAGGYEAAASEIERVVAKLCGPLPPLPSGSYPERQPAANISQPQFEAVVRRIKAYIEAGDGIQMVPSQRLSIEVDAHAVTIYRALRSLNPSPYMFLLRFGDFDLVGASPELLVSLHGSRCRVRPIAGTRWRGATTEEDEALAAELLADEKERAEHLMLVDLGRNDLGRVCKFGSVKVNEFMVVERYSHVMHIVSDVTGELQADKNGFDLIRACFPAGTVSGAPKVRAMEIIDEVEPTRRGSYAGAVGFISHSGDLDLCIAIRTILLKEGRAHVQAGAGIVFDSDPAREHAECMNKAQASLRAIALAQRGL